MSTPIDTIALLNRIRDLEAEVAAHEREREALNASWHSRCLRTEIRAEAAKTKLRAVGELPRYNIFCNGALEATHLYIRDPAGKVVRADELEALLK